MDKVLLVGDTHGDVTFALTAIERAQRMGCSAVVQVGDFGVWPGGESFLDSVSYAAGERGIDFVFLPGNHEDWDRLGKIGAADHSPPGFEGMFGLLRPNLWYTFKVNRFKMFGKSVLVAGGAKSIDKEHRVAGKSWWPEEMLTEEDVEFAKYIASRVRIDILLTHDAPTCLPTWPGFIKDDPDSNIHRGFMDSIWQVTEPTLWVHGHYHRFLEYNAGATRVVGLSCNTDGQYGIKGTERQNTMLLEIGDKELEYSTYNRVVRLETQ